MQIPNNVPIIIIKEQLETTKFLGIYFNENLKHANQINWHTTLEKMTNRNNNSSCRILSLYDKTILINTLILSKTPYLSNIFPLDAEITNKIHNEIFKYLWNNKSLLQENNKRENCKSLLQEKQNT